MLIFSVSFQIVICLARRSDNPFWKWFVFKGHRPIVKKATIFPDCLECRREGMDRGEFVYVNKVDYFNQRLFVVVVFGLKMEPKLTCDEFYDPRLILNSF